MNKNDSSSLIIIWWKTRKYLKKGCFNTLFPPLLGAVAFITDCFLDFTEKKYLLHLIETLLALDGGLLGFTIAGFGIFQSIPKSIINFALSTKAEDKDISYYKLLLLNYLHVLFITFSGITLLLVLYLASLADKFVTDLESLTILRHVYFSLIVVVQAYVLIKLKTFIFWIYENSLMLAQASAKMDHSKDPTSPSPLDEGNC